MKKFNFIRSFALLSSLVLLSSVFLAWCWAPKTDNITFDDAYNTMVDSHIDTAKYQKIATIVMSNYLNKKWSVSVDVKHPDANINLNIKSDVANWEPKDASDSEILEKLKYDGNVDLSLSIDSDMAGLPVSWSAKFSTTIDFKLNDLVANIKLWDPLLEIKPNNDMPELAQIQPMIDWYINMFKDKWYNIDIKKIIPEYEQLKKEMKKNPFSMLKMQKWFMEAPTVAKKYLTENKLFIQKWEKTTYNDMAAYQVTLEKNTLKWLLTLLADTILVDDDDKITDMKKEINDWIDKFIKELDSTDADWLKMYIVLESADTITFALDGTYDKEEEWSVTIKWQCNGSEWSLSIKWQQKSQDIAFDISLNSNWSKLDIVWEASKSNTKLVDAKISFETTDLSDSSTTTILNANIVVSKDALVEAQIPAIYQKETTINIKADWTTTVIDDFNVELVEDAASITDILWGLWMPIGGWIAPDMWDISPETWKELPIKVNTSGTNE